LKNPPTILSFPNDPKTMSESTTAREEALYSICLLAAFSDGGKADAEREELKEIGESLLPPEFNAAGIYQKVLLKRTTVAQESAKLDAPEWRQLAYEMAVKVCEADGVTSPAEKDFLANLAGELGIAKSEAVGIVAAGDEVAAADVAEVAPALLPALPPALPAVADKKSEVDSLILKYSILNGALELLPETLSTMAIIPLQMKLVNSVGKHHGVSLDKRQLLEFLGAAGIGATSQVVEGFAVKMIGGLAGKFGKQFLGKTAGGYAKKGVNQLTSSAFSFASTWAIGQLAQRYYANGRSWSGIDAKATFQNLRHEAEPLHQKLLPQIQEQAAGLDHRKVLAMLKGQP
jgi:uncharacterized protein (DUF697 family)/tellurite resistance protein